MQMKFNNTTYTIRQNAEGLHSLTDIEKAWLTEGGAGGQLRHWKDTPDVRDMLLSSEIRITNVKTRGANAGTWGCKEAVIEYASYCSSEFRRAVRKAFIALTEGDTLKAAAIAEFVAVSPELLEKHDAARNAMNAMIQAKGISMGGNAYGNFYRLACKAATGYVPSVLTGSNGTAKDYIKSAKHPACMNALITAMEHVVMGLKVGLDYHKIAAMLQVETTKNGELFA